MFAKVLKGDELTQRLISCMVVEYNLGPRVIIGGMRDSASVNGPAVRNVRLFYVDYFDVVCYSHTIDNVGSHFELQVLDSFVRFWIALFSPIAIMQSWHGERRLGNQSVPTALPDGGVNGRYLSKP